MAFKGFIEVFDNYGTNRDAASGGISAVWAGFNNGNSLYSPGMRGHGSSVHCESRWSMGVRVFPQTSQLSIFFTIKVGLFADGIQRIFQIRNINNQNVTYIMVGPLGHIMVGPNNNSATGALISEDILAPNTIENVAITLDITDPVNSDVKISIRGNTPTTGVLDISNAAGPYAAVAAAGWDITSQSLQADFDAIIFQCDSTELIPEVEGFWLSPNVDDTKGFTPLTGVDNFAMVDDPDGCDGDTTYNVADVVGTKDLFGVTNTTGIAESIWCLSQFSCARKEEAGTRQSQNILKLVNEHPGEPFALSQTWNWYYDHFQTNPESALPWQQADIDGIVKTGYAIVL